MAGYVNFTPVNPKPSGDVMTKSPMELPQNNRVALRQVCRSARKGALATHLAETGEPYASLVTVAFDHDLTPLLLLSDLSDHTKNLKANPQTSLLLEMADGLDNPQTGPRVSLQGLAAKTDDPRLKERYLARHPSARQYVNFGDFSIWKINLSRAHFVGGFGRAVWFDRPFGISPEFCAALQEAEAKLLAEFNASHKEKIAAATNTPAEGHMALLDGDGLDLVAENMSYRLNFATAADSLDSLRDQINQLF